MAINDWTLHDVAPIIQGFGPPAEPWTLVYWGGPASISFAPAAGGTTAVLTATLEDIGLVATTKVEVQAILAKTLEGVGLTSAMAVEVQAVMSKTLDSIILDAVSKIEVQAALNKLLEDMTASGTAVVDVQANLNKLLDDAVLVALIDSGEAEPPASSIGVVPIRYLVGFIRNVVPVQTVEVGGAGIVRCREAVGPANVVPVREAPTEVPRVKIILV
jgi:hypothetical protein